MFERRIIRMLPRLFYANVLDLPRIIRQAFRIV